MSAVVGIGLARLKAWFGLCIGHYSIFMRCWALRRYYFVPWQLAVAPAVPGLLQELAREKAKSPAEAEDSWVFLHFSACRTGGGGEIRTLI